MKKLCAILIALAISSTAHSYSNDDQLTQDKIQWIAESGAYTLRVDKNTIKKEQIKDSRNVNFEVITNVNVLSPDINDSRGRLRYYKSALSHWQIDCGNFDSLMFDREWFTEKDARGESIIRKQFTRVDENGVTQNGSLWRDSDSPLLGTMNQQICAFANNATSATTVQVGKKDQLTPSMYKSLKDLPDNSEVLVRALPAALIPKVCKEIGSIQQIAFNGAITLQDKGWALSQINQNGGADYLGVKMDETATCNALITVSGIYNGNSYNARLRCPVDKVTKNTKGLVITHLDYNCKSF
ncbi:hypothetical protein G6645_09160 [Polynucleobacter paneuropaeus]|nr:hypothetical protein [Polynucleobacter paneuropaeus]MBT8532735.1 hypothetical protein [Polynucleobacter paneuropaeus]MBT8602949.1 hypothetical protein [Polynucleobacter paneuropaeus]MBT8624901.1 hypothetical protein [Polynucleobacter paneuropaeus]MBT8630454.1 hypothetical protein [Polynucleobacter paneuropaeus]